MILFSHPADFTPVCTTELSEFARQQDYFTSQKTKLLGLSIDRIHSHIAWVNNVKAKLGVLMNFPIIADIDMRVAQLYGMLQPGESQTAAVRAVFFIDPAGKIRLIIYYPLNIGRNIDEVKRLLLALQTSDANKCAMPMNWEKGDKVIVPPPTTVLAMIEREASSYEMTDFYQAKRELWSAHSIQRILIAKPHIIVLGCNFAGLTTARYIHASLKDKATITIIDRR